MEERLPNQSLLWKKAVTARPSDACVRACMRKHVHTCVCKYPNPSLLPPSSLPLAKSKWKSKGMAAWAMCSVEAASRCRAGLRTDQIKRKLARIASQAGHGFPPCQWSVTSRHSDLRLPQPLRSPHPRQPGHRQPRGDPLEPLPLPATRLGHRVPLYPQGCEVLRQGEARGAGRGEGFRVEAGHGLNLRG